MNPFACTVCDYDCIKTDASIAQACGKNNYKTHFIHINIVIHLPRTRSLELLEVNYYIITLWVSIVNSLSKWDFMNNYHTTILSKRDSIDVQNLQFYIVILSASALGVCLVSNPFTMISFICMTDCSQVLSHQWAYSPAWSDFQSL